MARRSRALLVATAVLAVVAAAAAAVPPTCERIECPAYEVVDSANGFEIRRYTDAMWVSTAPIDDISFVAATRTGFLQLFNYIQGKNAYNETIEMTAPVLTEVSPSDGPFCASSFVVSFYVPEKNQADPPPAEGLRVQRWAGTRYAAVRRFGGFVADADVGEQAARLDASLQGTRWAAAVNEARRADPKSAYTVAQYNSPFEFSGRVNEIWMLFDGANEAAGVHVLITRSPANAGGEDAKAMQYKTATSVRRARRRGMVWVRVRRPPLLQSKLLCLSLLYLLTTLPLAIYVSFSDHDGRCLLLPFPSRAAVKALFEYPPGYGEHKHALTVPRALCSNPVVFADYKTALEEINGLCRNLSASPSTSSALRYQKGARDSFAGNLSAEERRSFFSHTDKEMEIPCGFFKEFPLLEADRLDMDKCIGVVVASAILNDYDKIRQPKGLGSETLNTACFFMFIDDETHRVLASHGVVTEDTHGGVTTVGAWRVVRLRAGELPYENPAMNGVIVKHLLHRLFPNARFSVWVDAKMQLTVDPLLLVHSLAVEKGVDMAVSRHPFNLHTMEEAIATARWHKWGDVEAIRVQMETYCENGLQPWSPSKLPYPSDVPDTAIIIRRHGQASDLFSCLLFNELEAFNPRDQLAFAYVRDQMSPKVSINMFEVEVFEQVAVEYRHNLKRDGGEHGKLQGATRMASSRDITGSSCERYLLKMWGEPTE